MCRWGLLLLLATSGCMTGMRGILRESSLVGGVPCPPAELAVDLESLDRGMGWTWRASCRGVDYVCARTFAGGPWSVSSETRCSPTN